MFGASLVSGFRCNYPNFQTLWFWRFLAQLPLACLLNFGGCGGGVEECPWRFCLHLWNQWCPPDCLTQGLLVVVFWNGRVQQTSCSIRKGQGFLGKEQSSQQKGVDQPGMKSAVVILKGMDQFLVWISWKSCCFRCTAFRSLGHYYDPRKSQVEWKFWFLNSK